MKHPVLAIALSACLPVAAAASTVAHVRDVFIDGGFASDAFMAVQHARHLVVGEGPHPFGEENGHAMWDPLGAGCIGAADPAAWQPGGARDPEAGALCLAQPCARLLTTGEMEHDVLGRPLMAGDWDVYSARHSETCTGEVVWVADASALDLVPEDAMDWQVVASSADGALSPTGSPSVLREGPVLRGSGGGPVFGIGPGIRVSRGRSGPGLHGPGGEGRPQPEREDQFDERSSFDPGGKTPRPGGGGDSEDHPTEPVSPEPAPVPLPGPIALLAAALLALRLPRR